MELWEARITTKALGSISLLAVDTNGWTLGSAIIFVWMVIAFLQWYALEAHAKTPS